MNFFSSLNYDFLLSIYLEKHHCAGALNPKQLY